MIIESILKQQLDKHQFLDCLEQQFETGYPNNGRTCPSAEPWGDLVKTVAVESDSCYDSPEIIE